MPGSNAAMTVMGKVGVALRTVARREGAQLRGTLFRLAAFGAAALALAALVGTAGTAGDSYSGTDTAGTKTGGEAWIVLDTGEAGSGRAAPVAALTAVQAPGRVTAAGLAAKPAPSGSCDANWDHMKNIRTSDPDPGGKFQFNPCTHQVRISDTEKDGHLVRGGVALDGVLVVTLRAAGNPAEDVATIPHYDPKKLYIFKVCLAGSDIQDDSYCDSSDNQHWATPDRGGPDPCYSVVATKGAEDNCRNGRKLFGYSDKDKEKYEKWKNALRGPDLKNINRPPVGRKPDINARPDLSLPRTQPGDAGKMTQPVAIMLRWLVWTVLGGCVAGFVIVGGRMTIRHKRGELGANASELGWVVLAVVVAGSGMAIAFVSLLVDPF